MDRALSPASTASTATTTPSTPCRRPRTGSRPGEARDAFAREFTAVQTLWEFLDPHAALTAHRADYRGSPRSTRRSSPPRYLRRAAVAPARREDPRLWSTATSATSRSPAPASKKSSSTPRPSRPCASWRCPAPTWAVEGPVTVAEALDTIDVRLRRRLESSGRHPIYIALSERLERLRRAQLDKAAASIEFLRELLELAQQVTAAERAEDEGGPGALSLLPDPNVGALTQIVREYAPIRHPGHPRERRRRHRHHRPPGPLLRLERDPGRRPHGPQGGAPGPQEVRPADHRRPVRPRLRLHPRELLMRAALSRRGSHRRVGVASGPAFLSRQACRPCGGTGGRGRRVEATCRGTTPSG